MRPPKDGYTWRELQAVAGANGWPLSHDLLRKWRLWRFVRAPVADGRSGRGPGKRQTWSPVTARKVAWIARWLTDTMTYDVLRLAMWPWTPELERNRPLQVISSVKAFLRQDEQHEDVVLTANPRPEDAAAVSAQPSGNPLRLRALPTLRPVEERLPLMPRCRSCGRELRQYRQKDCEECAVIRRDASIPSLVRAAEAARAARRVLGTDGSNSEVATSRRAHTNALRHAEARTWRRSRAQMAEDRETFRKDVLPRIQKLEVAGLARLTGLSKAQCSLVRRGLRTLHPRHWAAALDA